MGNIIYTNDLSFFYEKTTVSFNSTVYLDDVAQDITGGIVAIILKRDKNDADGDAVLNELADVTTEGANGVALFLLSVANTTISPRVYFAELRYVDSTAQQFILDSWKLSVKRRVFD